MTVKKSDQSNLVVNQVIIKAPQRKTSDVGQWRTALQSADNGRMKLLYDLYEDLLIDGVLADAMDKRISAVTNSELTFQNAKGESVPEIMDLIDSMDMEELLTQIMHVRFWGRAAVEFDFTTRFRVYEIPKKHIDLKGRQILLNEYDTKGVPYEDDDNLMVLGKQRDYGMFLRTAPFAIWKRGGFGDYAQWLEIFGMPQRVGKYSSYDPESRKLLEEAMENAGSAPWIVIPKETEVETTNNTGNNSSGAGFNDFRKACNEEILITVLGQTLTTIQGDKGARSLGEVHKVVEEGKNRSDLRFVQRILNQRLLPLLEKRGYPVNGGWFVFPRAARELTVSEIVQLSEIMEIPAIFLHEKFSIPVPEKGESIARRQTNLSKSTDLHNNNVQNSSHGTNPPDDYGFWKRLMGFFVHAPALTGATGNHLMRLIDGDFNDRLMGRMDGKQNWDAELFDFISQNLIQALKVKSRQMKDVEFVYNYQSDAFLTAQELNVFQFSAAKTLAEINELNRLYRESESFEEFYQKASKLTDVFNKTWQRTEYYTATNVASSSDTYQRLIKKTRLFPYWQYKTVGDDRVREEHWKLHGVILPANDPRWNKIWPPNGWRCRCYIVPRMASDVEGIVDIKANRARVDAYLSSSEWSKIKKQGFGINRAVTAQVFTANQMYLNKFPTRAGKLLKDVNYRTYNLGSFEQNRQQKTSEYMRYQGSAEAFLTNQEQENDLFLFRDYNERRVVFDYPAYQKNHKKVYAERTEYFPAMKEALKMPDEVWISATHNNLNTYNFIKYYRDVTIAAVAEVKGGNIYRIRTWFPVNENNKKALQLRSGLLIKKGGE
ncbi:MAG: hypothetical protein PWQ06_2026 [Anaerophaga sp.]|nr:hypothetical protein [Anaerophaga sp.]